MATLMFYQAPAPLNSAVHLRMRVRPLNGDFRFAAGTNSVPLAAVEFFDVAKEYPIVFGEGDHSLPVMLSGVRNQENLLVGEKGEWKGRYVPAFIRRYPFVLSERPDSQEFNVFIDEGYEGINKDDGERLFNDDGSHTVVLQQALEFLTKFQGEVERTARFVRHITELGLLVPRRLEVSRPGQPPLALQGFSVVDEAKLQSLDDNVLVEMAKSGELAWIYAHLMSLSNVGLLAERVEQTKSAPSTPEPSESGDSGNSQDGSTDRSPRKGKSRG